MTFYQNCCCPLDSFLVLHISVEAWTMRSHQRVLKWYDDFLCQTFQWSFYKEEKQTLCFIGGSRDISWGDKCRVRWLPCIGSPSSSSARTVRKYEGPPFVNFWLLSTLRSKFYLRDLVLLRVTTSHLVADTLKHWAFHRLQIINVCKSFDLFSQWYISGTEGVPPQSPAAHGDTLSWKH